MIQLQKRLAKTKARERMWADMNKPEDRPEGVARTRSELLDEALKEFDRSLSAWKKTKLPHGA